MPDKFSKEKRSNIMSHVRGNDNSIEIAVRKSLFNSGYRFRKNVKNLPGKPDVVLKKYNTAIFINGCFWHHHNNCKYATIPNTNTEFWINKLERNEKNDRKNIRKLRKMGYHVITIWGCKLKKDPEKEMKRVKNLLNSYINE